MRTGQEIPFKKQGSQLLLIRNGKLGNVLLIVVPAAVIVCQLVKIDIRPYYLARADSVVQFYSALLKQSDRLPERRVNRIIPSVNTTVVSPGISILIL